MIVYAGAIVVLFLFVIMLLGVDRSDDIRVEPFRVQRPVAIIIGVAIVGLVGTAVLSGAGELAAITGERSVGGTLTGPARHREAGPLAVLDYVFAFEVTSILLVVAVLATVILARRPFKVEPSRPPGSQGGGRAGHGGRGGGLPMILAEVTPTPTWYLLLAAVLFAIGTVGLLIRRNPLVMFMCIELMLNAVNLSFVALSVGLDDVNGQTAVFFVLVVAAAEVVVGLGIIVALLRRKPGATADDVSLLRG